MPVNDKIILDKLKDGDYFTFEHVFKKYQPRLFAIASRFLKDEAMACEAVNDVFIKIWERRKNLIITKSLEAYLVTSTKNQCLNKLRAKKKEAATHSETDIAFFTLEHEHWQNEGILEKIISEELDMLVAGAINKLPAQQQKIFNMSRSEGLSGPEIAKKTNLSRRTVETHLYLALKSLKEQLTNIIR